MELKWSPPWAQMWFCFGYLFIYNLKNSNLADFFVSVVLPTAEFQVSN